MGTRADFYLGRGKDAEWLGSVAWDGYPDGIFDEAPELFSSDAPVTGEEWHAWVGELLAGRNDGTRPEQGWPWPWDNSNTTDYAYALDDGAIWGSCFGGTWFRVDPEAEDFGQPDDDERPAGQEFPDMSSRKAVTYGQRSGAMFVSFRRDDS